MARPLRPFLVALLCAAGLSRSAAAPPVVPVDPPDGAVVGARPVFRLGIEELDEDALRRARFRIALSRDGFRSEAYVFDQRQRRTGWAGADEGFVLYLPRSPIADGEYEWRSWAWNGVEWIGGERTFGLRVDTVAPAEIADLKLERDRRDDSLELCWSPLALDASGGPEFVARYHVYRYDKPPFPAIPRQEVGVTESTCFRVEAGAPGGAGAAEAADPLGEPEELGERGAPTREPALLFFSVVAEDEAGNRAVMRDAASPDATAGPDTPPGGP